MSGLPNRASRTRVVAFQAVGVALIGAIVFIAFLRPSEPGDLTGIDASGGDGDADTPSIFRPDQPEDDDPEAKPRSRGNDRPGRRGSGGGDGSDLAGLGALAALVEDGGSTGSSSAGGGTSPPSLPSGGGGGGNPPSNQYDDLPSALMAEVGRPSLFRAIDP